MSDEERRRAIQAANQRRGGCQKCGNTTLETRTGEDVGGLPGLVYLYCGACGASRAKKVRGARA